MSDTIQRISDFSTVTEIKTNTDLNDITRAGAFYCGSGAVAATLTNSPINNSGFVMEVLNKGAQWTQVIHQGSLMYTRSRFSDGWGDWFRYDGVTVNTFYTQYFLVAPGTTTITTNDVTFAFLSFSDGAQAIYGCSGSNANKLCGTIPSSASVSFSNGTLTIVNPNTWNGRGYLIYR